jgi:hypothetical protein
MKATTEFFQGQADTMESFNKEEEKSIWDAAWMFKCTSFHQATAGS